ncbi:MAG TPA: nitroreductase [Clostridiales bacterium]|nr:nitroreductase [Clostridiales bacterium]
MSLYDLIITKRTVRRFKQDPIPDEIVSRIMEAARQAPSGANIQPLKYMVIKTADMCKKVFENTGWAGYLKGEGTPKEGEQPVLYVVILVDTQIRNDGAKHDCGAAAQNMMLAAWEEGIGSCWIGSLKRDNLVNVLGIDERYVIDTVIAFGYSDEQVVSEDAKGDIKYYRDENMVHHVPKRTLAELILKSF